MVDLDLLREEFIKICEEKYEYSSDDTTYFISYNDKACNVRQYIMSKLKPEFRKSIYINSISYILDVNGNVIINVV